MKSFLLSIVFLLVFSSCTMIQLVKNKHKESYVTTNLYCKFKMNKNKVLIQTSFPDDRAQNLALDLGAGSTMLFRNSGLKHIEALKPVLSFGKILSADNQVQKADYYFVGPIQTKAFKLDNAFLPMVPDFQTFSCDTIAGVWGADAFDQKILLLNMQDSIIAVLDSLPLLDDWTLAASEYKFPHFYVIFGIENQKIKLLFDTGCTSGIVISEETYLEKLKKQGILLNEQQKWYGQAFVTASGITGTDTTTTAILLHSSWGNMTPDSIPITVSKKIKRDVIGMDVLKRFNFLLDYSNQKMYIQKNTDYRNSPKTGFLYQQGFNYRGTKDGNITVSLIRVNSLAEKAGLKIDDKIISVNGIDLLSADKCFTDKAFSEMNSTRKNEIVIRREGEELTIVL